MGNRAGAFCSVSVCPKSGQHPDGDHEIYDDVAMCDPAGAVFLQNLEDLNEVDRLLMNFASTSNLVAVRWLLVLGANVDVCDTNGTTCLHAACRSGSLAVVRDFIQRELPLDSADTAGWTPLHVAFFMGRRKVAVELMSSNADLSARNFKGHTPADLCSDVWLREAINACSVHRQAHGRNVPWSQPFDSHDNSKVSLRLRFEPFFVPRAPVMKGLCGSSELIKIGTEIFNQRPGQGIAFLVATGCVKDFPVELSNFLMENQVSPTMVGEFLGEDFSLSQTLRLEYINSVRVVGTGVVSCLSKVFQKFHIPSDMHKINRLIDAVAQIWWRQHETIKDKTIVVEDEFSGADSGEFEGLSLMKYLGDHNVLHQLMLSTVLLHWNLYAPLPPSQRISVARWIDMNAGIAEGKGGQNDPSHVSMLKHIQCLVYDLISHDFRPELQIWSSGCPGGITGTAVLDKTISPRPFTEENNVPAVEVVDEKQGAVNGWATLVGSNFPSLAVSSGTVTYRQIRGILSETTSSTLISPSTSRSMPCPQGAYAEPQQQYKGCKTGLLKPSHTYGHPALPSSAQENSGTKHSPEGGHDGDRVWMSMHQALLFLAPKPQGWAPYAIVHLRGVVVQGWDQDSLVLTLVLPRRDSYREADGNPSELDQIQLIFLLPDGRWQVIELPQLQVQLPDLEQLDLWLRCLEVHRNLPVPSSIGPRPLGGITAKPAMEATAFSEEPERTDMPYI